MKEAVAVLSGIAALVVVLTLLQHGSLNLGTGGQGPYVSVGYRGF